MKTILVDALHTLVIKGDGVFKEMQELLDSYPNKKIVLTNAPYTKFQEFFFDQIPYQIFTLEQNPEKNNPDYYKQMLNYFDLTVDGVIYFEHNLDAVKSAESLGIKVYLYDDKKRDLERLKLFLSTNL